MFHDGNAAPPHCDRTNRCVGATHVVQRHRFYPLHAHPRPGRRRIGGREAGEIAFHCLAGLTAATLGKAIHYARAAHLRLAVARLPDLPTRSATLALAEAFDGDPDQARILLHRATVTNFETHYGPVWLGCMCQWAAVAAELGDTIAAAILYGKLRPWKDLFGMAGPMPIHGVSHTLG